MLAEVMVKLENQAIPSIPSERVTILNLIDSYYIHNPSIVYSSTTQRPLIST
jgi:hypothetical protein